MNKFNSNSNKPNICILLTAAIDPKGVIFMQRNNPLVRENDYIESIKKWLENTTYPLVFCENSGYSLHKIEKIIKSYLNRETEILQFDGQDFPREVGKGYGELLTIKYVIQHSTLSKHYDYVIKVNGRYFIKNIKKIAEVLVRNHDIYVMADLKNTLEYSDSRVFAFKIAFVLDYLSQFHELINDSAGFYLEHALARAVLRAISDGYKWVPLPAQPTIIGYSGTFNTPYRASKIRRLTGEIIKRVKNI
jgi:hypothetical protein